MNLIKENISNLTSLWELAAVRAGSFTTTQYIRKSKIDNSDWPNRLWFTKKPCKELITNVKPLVTQERLTVSVWEDQEDVHNWMLSAGFLEKLSLAGMSLSLSNSKIATSNLKIKQVKNAIHAIVWMDLFEASFGYKIPHWVIEATMNDIQYFIGYDGSTPVGTAALFQNKPTIIGLHSMGVIPEQRRKGFAEAMLDEMINKAAASGATYMTLQASEMGKSLYLKRGFEEQFIIRNYTLKH